MTSEEGPATGLEPRAELVELAASVRALVEWHAATGSLGLPCDDALETLLPRTGLAPSATHRPSHPSPTQQRPMAAPSQLTVPTPVSAPARATATAPTVAPKIAAPAIVLSPEARRARLAALAVEASTCTRCALGSGRKQAVFARGNPVSEICFVGEGPGADEDEQGEPFVGAAGQLLDRMIAAMGCGRDDVYITNIVKCRPPNNRKPEPAEMTACLPYLTEQIALVQPRALVALGATAVQGLLGPTEGITRLRGKWKLYKGALPVMPTFHPAYLLRQPSAKRDVWADLKEVLRFLGKSAPPRG